MITTHTKQLAQIQFHNNHTQTHKAVAVDAEKAHSRLLYSQNTRFFLFLLFFP